MTIQATEYRVAGFKEVSIVRCPALRSPLGDKPAYWYARQPLHPWDWLFAWRQGHRHYVWDGETWAVWGQKHFDTAEECAAELAKWMSPSLMGSPDVVHVMKG